MVRGIYRPHLADFQRTGAAVKRETMVEMLDGRFPDLFEEARAVCEDERERLVGGFVVGVIVVEGRPALPVALRSELPISSLRVGNENINVE